MKQQEKQWNWSPKLHECAVIYGTDAVDAYNEGQTSLEALKGLGQVKFYNFGTIPELNAFLRGIDAAQGALDALPVDDLTV
jgi:hypothetical protein